MSHLQGNPISRINREFITWKLGKRHHDLYEVTQRSRYVAYGERVEQHPDVTIPAERSTEGESARRNSRMT